jgi:hypothetical protein
MRYREERAGDADARRLGTAVTIHTGKPALNSPARSVVGEREYKRLAPNPPAKPIEESATASGPRLKFQSLQLPELSEYQ